jgi:hypothetical protein
MTAHIRQLTSTLHLIQTSKLTLTSTPTQGTTKRQRHHIPSISTSTHSPKKSTMPPKGQTPKNSNSPTRESTNKNKNRTDRKSPLHDNSIDFGVSDPLEEAAPGDNEAAINKNNNKDTGRGCAAKSTPRDSSISVDVIVPSGGTAQTGDNEANNTKSVVEPQTDNSPGANVGIPSGETALTDDNNAPTVPTTKTDTTPAATNNTVDNEPAEIQNKIQDNNKITSKMTPTDHISSATALRSADAVNPNMRILQKSNDINIFNVS